jgi:hypothetical protein
LEFLSQGVKLILFVLLRLLWGFDPEEYADGGGVKNGSTPQRSPYLHTAMAACKETITVTESFVRASCPGWECQFKKFM